MSPVQLNVSEGPGRVCRVGFEPGMWAWTPWRYAKLQRSSTLEAALDDLDDDDGSVALHTEGGSGQVGLFWPSRKSCGEADQNGRRCFVTHFDSLAALKAQ